MLNHLAIIRKWNLYKNNLWIPKTDIDKQIIKFIENEIVNLSINISYDKKRISFEKIIGHKNTVNFSYKKIHGGFYCFMPEEIFTNNFINIRCGLDSKYLDVLISNILCIQDFSSDKWIKLFDF